ncbi:hypothetical protein D3C71_1577620 [compost metagenome]
MLVQRDQRTQGPGRQCCSQQRIAGAVTLDLPVSPLELRLVRLAVLAQGAPEGQRLGLGEHVRQQLLVTVGRRRERPQEPDEIAGHDLGALVQQLMERVLAVGSACAPVDGAGMAADRSAVLGDGLAVAFHHQLLDIGGEPAQVVIVGQNCNGSRTQEVVVPHGHQSKQRGEIAFQRRRQKMRVHVMEPGQHLAKCGWTDGRQHGQPHCRTQ